LFEKVENALNKLEKRNACIPPIAHRTHHLYQYLPSLVLVLFAKIQTLKEITCRRGLQKEHGEGGGKKGKLLKGSK
jgi:hypothetical protein